MSCRYPYVDRPMAAGRASPCPHFSHTCDLLLARRLALLLAQVDQPYLLVQDLVGGLARLTLPPLVVLVPAHVSRGGTLSVLPVACLALLHAFLSLARRPCVPPVTCFALQLASFPLASPLPSLPRLLPSSLRYMTFLSCALSSLPQLSRANAPTLHPQRCFLCGPSPPLPLSSHAPLFCLEPLLLVHLVEHALLLLLQDLCSHALLNLRLRQ